MSCSWNEECGIVGVYGHPEAANLTYLGLYALQHRGQESAGIVSSDGKGIYCHKEMGLVAEIFDQDILKRLPGGNAIGHVRYSTAGGSHLKNAQPFVFDYSKGGIAIAHNGNLINAQTLRDQLEREGAIFQSTMDTEVIIHLFAHAASGSTVERIIAALQEIKGAYSLIFLNEKELIAVRDPHGFRPLVLGRIKQGYVVASETCAFDLIGAEFIREIEPGEVVLINEAGIQSFHPFPRVNHQFCIFEFIYFARPDSQIFGRNVYQVRRELGVQLAKEHPAEADVVIATPDSGIPAAIGYAHQSGIPLELGIIRNHYVGRTFKAQRRQGGPQRQEGGGPGRLHRARHHGAEEHADDQERGCERGACAHQLSPDHRLLLLRDRYPDQGRAHCLLPLGGGGEALYRSRFPGTPQPGGAQAMRRPP